MAVREWVETASSWCEMRIFKLVLTRRRAMAVLLSFSVVQFDFVHGFSSIMATFQEVREVGVACFEDIIDKDEFLLWDFNTSKNLDCPYDNYNRFDLDEMYDSECIGDFRVKKCDLPDLAAAQEIPNQFVCHQRSVAVGMEGLCVLL